MTGQAAVIIGGGIAGLAVAALLCREGFSVTLLEARNEVGGRAGSWLAEGFRFDTGPSWYLMPEVFDHFYRLLGTTAAEQLRLTRLDPGYRAYFQGVPGSLDVPAGRQPCVDLFESVQPGAGRALSRYLDSAGDIYRLAQEKFLYSTFASVRPFLTREVVARLPRLALLLGQPLEGFVARRFEDPRLRQLLGYPAVFLGCAPSIAPSLYHLMSHLDLDDGVWYPAGGITSVIDTIADLATEAGVRIRTACRAVSIRTRDTVAGARVVGVDYLRSDGSHATASAEIVVSAADLHHTETALLPSRLQTYPERWWARRNPGPGAVLACLGVAGKMPQLAHHNLFLTRDWDANFAAIFSSPGRIPDPASLYACRASASDVTVAPDGDENLFLLVPVPAEPAIGAGGTGGAGSRAVERTVDAAVRQVADWAGIPDLAKRIRVRRTIGPADFRDGFNSWRGGALGPAHTLRQSAFLRGRNTSAKVAGLYYAGGSTVPGIGLPMCLISAELVVKRLRGDTTAAPLPEPDGAGAGRRGSAAGAARP